MTYKLWEVYPPSYDLSEELGSYDDYQMAIITAEDYYNAEHGGAARIIWTHQVYPQIFNKLGDQFSYRWYGRVISDDLVSTDYFFCITEE